MIDDADLAALMTTLDDPSFFAALSPELAASAAAHAPADPTTSVPSAAVALLDRDGWFASPEVVGAPERAAIAACVDALAREGLPALFVYAFPSLWELGARLASAISRALGAHYDVIEDAWAFRVPAGPTHAGWPAHRGSYELARDRRAPDSLNVWIAISDATIDNSCMFLVPLDRDPAYPDDLRSHAAVEAGVAAPVPAGTALVWNANVLHWGGPSTARATEPRTSVTFTLRRGGARADVGDHAKRLDVIADQILVYGELERTLSPRVRRWAELRVGLRNLVRPR